LSYAPPLALLAFGAIKVSPSKLDLLAPVYNWFTEGFDTPVLQGAKALLEQLSP
jgi:hypothetical protein